MRRPRGEDGTVLVLVVGFTAVLLLLVAVVVDVSVVILAKRGAQSAADAAAVAAVQQVDSEALYDRGLYDELPLDPAAVRAVVQDVGREAAADQPGLRLSASTEGTTARVEARRTVGLPFGGWLGIGTVEVRALARARAPVTARRG